VRDVTRFQLQTVIAAPIERVYDLARDIDLHARSMAHSNERPVAGRTSGRIGLGETVTWRARHFGITWQLTSRITVAEPPTRFVDEQVRGPFRSFRHEHRFEAVHAGTVMIDDWEHIAPFGILGRLADRLVLERHLRGLLETRNRTLKTEAERSPAADQVVGSGTNGPSAVATATNSGDP
jgi:ligand-binding SRPBCC domain-containing protein